MHVMVELTDDYCDTIIGSDCHDTQLLTATQFLTVIEFWTVIIAIHKLTDFGLLLAG
jgi:hypothetical protein